MGTGIVIGLVTLFGLLILNQQQKILKEVKKLKAENSRHSNPV